MTAAELTAPERQAGPSGLSNQSNDAPQRDRGRIWAMLNPDRAWRDSTPWTSAFSQVVLIAIASVLYFLVRGLTKDQAAVAFQNARTIVEFEESLRLDLEVRAQALILDSDWLIAFFNWVYMFLHWPLIIAALGYTFLRNRPIYVLYRDAIMVSGLIGLLFFAFFPVAPPRLFDTSVFFDSVAELSQTYKILQPKSIVNQFAALPSFHVGWNILAGYALLCSASRWSVRLFAVLSPALMTLAVVFTANHWVVDVFAGSAIALVALTAARCLRRRTQSSGEPTPHLA